MKASLLDRAFLRWSPPRPCFAEGWGDIARFEDLSLASLLDEVPQPVLPAWGPLRSWRGVARRDGHFVSPVDALPAALRPGRARWLEPSHRSRRGVCVMLAAWNDEDFAFRSKLMLPLVKRGLTLVLLENPFYGSRRLAGRDLGTPRTVEEFVALGLGTVLEARGLLASLSDVHDVCGVIGFSMGGHMAAITAALTPWPLRVVAMAPSCTPASVFLDGMLAPGTDVRALATKSARTEDGGERLRAVLDRFRVDALPAPVAPDLALVMGTRKDGIVPPCEPARIAAHWQSRIQWLDTGHVGAVTLHRRALCAAVADTFGL